MTEQYLVNSIYIAVFLVGGIVAGLAPFILSHLLKPRIKAYKRTGQIYECGIEPYGEAWDFRYGVTYYLYALMFLAFDVDILYLFPVVDAYDKVSGVRGVVELVIFVGILSLAIVYAWVKGVFSWEKKKQVL